MLQRRYVVAYDACDMYICVRMPAHVNCVCCYVSLWAHACINPVMRDAALTRTRLATARTPAPAHFHHLSLVSCVLAPPSQYCFAGIHDSELQDHISLSSPRTRMLLASVMSQHPTCGSMWSAALLTSVVVAQDNPNLSLQSIGIEYELALSCAVVELYKRFGSSITEFLQNTTLREITGACCG